MIPKNSVIRFTKTLFAWYLVSFKRRTLFGMNEQVYVLLEPCGMMYLYSRVLVCIPQHSNHDNMAGPSLGGPFLSLQLLLKH